jgi:hypothetical protein
MAAVLKSTFITNRDATPKALTDAYISGGETKVSQGWVKTGASDAAASTYILASVPSNARLDSLDFQCDSLGSGCQVNIGAYYPTFIPAGTGLAGSLANTAINSSVFASAQSCSNAVARTNLITQANLEPWQQEQPLWQMVGLTSDPGPELSIDLVVSVKVATAAAGYVGLNAKYVY